MRNRMSGGVRGRRRKPPPTRSEEMMILTGEGWGKQSLGYFFQEVHKIGNCFI